MKTFHLAPFILLFFLLLSVLFVSALAQEDSTSKLNDNALQFSFTYRYNDAADHPVLSSTPSIPVVLVNNKDLLLFALILCYEIAVRLIPTKSKYWSITSVLGKIINFIIPNKTPK